MRRSRSALLRVGSLPSREAELVCYPEGRFANLPSSEAELRGVVEGLGRETSSEAEIAPRFEGGANGLYCRARPWAEGEVGLFESFPFLPVGRRL